MLDPSGNRPILLFVTVATKDRLPLLANPVAFHAVLSAWEAAGNWLVGRYVVMPDHIHFFCSPGLWPTPDFHKWMAYWKSLATRAFWASRVFPETPIRPFGRDALPRVQVARQRDFPHRHPPLFQRDCWDTQLRQGDNYSGKWAYVRLNPVRKGLAATPEDWPWQGEMHLLHWRD